jgi:hypothetical protein
MLTPAAHVPHMLCGDVAGLDGTRAAVDLPADLLDRCTVWVIGRDIAGVHLDLAGIEALQRLLADAAGRMRAAMCGGILARTGAIQAIAATDAGGDHL